MNNTPLIALMHAVESLRLKHPGRTLLIGLDGRCASGKTTLAQQFAQAEPVQVIHMDDFCIPHAKKTPERLALPGGNADLERFRQEVLLPLQRGQPGVYRAYDCHLDRLTDPRPLQPAPLTLIEGVYTLHPDLQAHFDLRAFLDIEPPLQERRIRSRNGEDGWLRFRDRWIPLENAYFAAFGLPDAACLHLHAEDEEE